MGRDAQDRVVLSDEAKKQFEDCVAAIAAGGFGPDGPPIDTTFAEIEEYGHEAGKMLARALDEKLTDQHAAHDQETAACPSCGAACSVRENTNTRDILTTDGDVPQHESVCHCPACERDFFPQRIALKIDGRSYSPRVLETSIFCAARDPAYKLAAETLRETAEIQISARHLRNHAGTEALKRRNEPRVWHFVEPLQGEISSLIANPGRRCARYCGLRSAPGSIVAGPSAPPLTAQSFPRISRGSIPEAT